MRDCRRAEAEVRDCAGNAARAKHGSVQIFTFEACSLSDKSTEEALRKSLEFFEQALEKDPRFARAWTGIAKSWLWLADAYVKPLEAYSKVGEAAMNAINIDDAEAEAHVYLAETKRILDWNPEAPRPNTSARLKSIPIPQPPIISSLHFMLRSASVTKLLGI